MADRPAQIIVQKPEAGLQHIVDVTGVLRQQGDIAENAQALRLQDQVVIGDAQLIGAFLDQMFHVQGQAARFVLGLTALGDVDT